ncbi:Dcp1p-Dcp2p decapping enzyme complex alpha subunit [Savitreella phatthalungensis]
MTGEPPPIPGATLIGPERDLRREQVSKLLGTRNPSLFPGAQPVSFDRGSIDKLLHQDYYVCEKSDGTRCLMYCSRFEDGREATFLINRKNDYYSIPRLHFPLPADRTFKSCHSSTILDGELVLDIYPDGKKRLVFLAFDMLLYEGKDIRERNLSSRLGYLQQHFLEPLKQFVHANSKHAARFPFDVKFKKMELAYAIGMMFDSIIPKLLHGNDGLIFTSLDAPYRTGTDETLIKWKPADENSVDFQLRFKFPTLPDGSEDTSDPPTLELWAMHTEHDYRFFALMFADEDDFERFAEDGTRFGGLDGAIVECRLDQQGRWRYMRPRDDKQHANHISVIHKVLASIEAGVTREELLSAAIDIRRCFKERQTVRKAQS